MESVTTDPIVFRFQGAGPRGHNRVPAHLSDFELRKFNGFLDSSALAGTATCVVHDPPAIVAESLIRSSGEWIAVLGRRDSAGSSEFLVVGDYFGHQKIFFAFCSGEVLVSTSYDHLLRELACAGEYRDPNWSYVVPTLTSQNVFCAGAWASSTMHEGVFELFPGELLWIRRDQVVTFRRPEIKGVGSDKPSQYDQLIELGIDAAVRQLREIANAVDGPIRISLSGGRDSRVVLALAMRAGISDRLVLSPSNPRSHSGASRDVVENDLAISQLIGEIYNLPNAEDEAYIVEDVEFSELIESFQIVNSGGAYGLPSSTAHSYPRRRQIELHGAGGELLRTAFSEWPKSNWWKRLITNSETSLRGDVRALFDVVFRAHLFSKSKRERGIAELARALDINNSKNLIGALNHHYGIHRNRWHFGGRLISISGNRWLSYPLEQPEFVAAASLLSFDHRQLGVVAFDIIERTVPSLNSLPFDNAPGWPSEVYKVMRTPVRTADRVKPSELRLSQARNLLERNAKRRLNGVKVRGDRTAGRALGRALYLLELSHRLFPEDINLSFRNSLAGMLRTGKLDVLQSVSRLQSMLVQYLRPPQISSYEVGFNCASSGSGRLSSRSCFELARDKSYDADLQDVELFVSAVRQGEVINVEARLFPMRDSRQWEFAFYLMSDENRVAYEWYSSSPVLQFSSVGRVARSDLSELTIRAFARRINCVDSLPLISQCDVD